MNECCSPKNWILFFLFSVWANALYSQVSLAKIFSDNMVLQAHRPIKIWGTASPYEKVRVILDDQEKITKANADRKWMLEFPPMNYGKPIALKVIGKKNKMELSNILIGEVWLCSGQSNMAMTVNGSGGQVYNYRNEEGNARYPNIRSFKVKPNLSAKTGVDVDGEWVVCSPETVSEFSAVAYFFARKLHQEVGVPVGIINSSWGGTDIETWTSMDVFASLPERFKSRYKEVTNIGVEAALKKNEENRNAFERIVATEAGIKEQWYEPSFPVADWKKMEQPKEWSQTELAAFDGVAWFRYELNLLDKDAGRPGTLSLGKIDDNDVAWINGVKVGETRGAGYDRIYNVPSGVLKAGKNTIIIKVTDEVRGGGFTGIANDLYIKTDNGQYSLAGDWLYKTSVAIKDLNFEHSLPNFYYGLLYNAMIDPLKDFAIKGVIWYQGENNAGQAYHYRTLFPSLIRDWRSKWGYDFPFYWVQLAGFMANSKVPPVADAWAELREAQTLTLAVEHTGQAIATDIGDANDIHPRNKQDVGLRLADIALNKDYNRTDIVYTGPTYKSMKIDGDKIIIEFDNVASGLQVNSKYGYVEGFAIAGSDKKFTWANAKIKGNNSVVVFSDQIDKPVAVRYCWAINPDVNLFNSAGLPAGPFRTDTWKLSTEQ